MLGAIIGDIIGSPYEFDNIETTDFPLFTKKSFYTDDTILTIAICDAILKGIPYKDSILWWADRYPNPYGGYGGYFFRWLNMGEHLPYNSYGNGSAMRASAIGWLFNDIGCVLREAELSASVTHNHPEGIKGAQAIAAGIYMARNGKDKEQIKDYIQTKFKYDLSTDIIQTRDRYVFDDTCMGTVPLSFICFLDTNSYEEAIRKVISFGGDSDTLTCITGALAEAYYRQIPIDIIRPAIRLLPYDMWLVLYEFLQKTRDKRKAPISFFFFLENYRRVVIYALKKYIPLKEKQH